MSDRAFDRLLAFCVVALIVCMGTLPRGGEFTEAALVLGLVGIVALIAWRQFTR